MIQPLEDRVRAHFNGQFFDKYYGEKRELHGACPLCSGTPRKDSDRFIVFPDQEGGDIAKKAGIRGTYACRKCKASGDYVTYLKEIDGMTWKEIFQYLEIKPEQQQRNYSAYRAPQPVNRTRREGRKFSELERITLPSPLWREHAKKFFLKATEGLQGNAEAQGYLMGRGITPDVWEHFQLGWNQRTTKNARIPCTYRMRKAWGLSEPEHNGRIKKKLWLPEGIVIPTIRGGEVVALQIRLENPPPDFPTYHMVTGSKKGCFIYPARAKVYVLVEARLDALTILSARIPDVGVCALGSLSAYPDLIAARELSNALCIINGLDFEPTGKAAKDSSRVLSWWDKTFRDRIVRAPVAIGKDVGELYQHWGFEGVQFWIRENLPETLKIATYNRPPAIYTSIPMHTDTNTQMHTDTPQTPSVPEEIKRLHQLQIETGLKIQCTPESYGIVLDSRPSFNRSDAKHVELKHVLFLDCTIQFLEKNHFNKVIHAGELLDIEW